MYCAHIRLTHDREIKNYNELYLLFAKKLNIEMILMTHC